MLIAAVCGVAMTAIIFLVIPLSQLMGRLAQPESAPLQAAVSAPPPPPPPPPPPEEEEPEEEPPPPELEPEQPELDIPMPDLPEGFGGGSFFIDEKYNIDIAKEALGGLFDADQLDESPRPLSTSPPRYPSAMRRSKKEGRVIVYMVIDETGRVDSAEVRQSTDPGFEAEALKAVRQWKFKPGTKNGRPVRARILQPISFKLGR